MAPRRKNSAHLHPPWRVTHQENFETSSAWEE
jgi:hypothetical protein